MLDKKFIKKWTYKNSLKIYINKLVDLFQKQFSEEELKIIQKLLNSFIYFDEEAIKNQFSDYLSLVRSSIEGYKSFFLTIPNKEYAINNSNTTRFFATMGRWPYDIKFLNSYSGEKLVIIVDDYCGSGETISGFITSVLDVVEDDVKIVYCPFVCTEFGKRIIKDSFPNVQVDALLKSRENALETILSIDEKQSFIDLSLNHSISEKYVQGYNSVQDLYSNFITTPNDTLGIFWQTTNKNLPIFQRNDNNGTRYYIDLKFREALNNCIKTKDRYLRQLSFLALLLKFGYTKYDIARLMNVNDCIFEDIYNRRIIDDENAFTKKSTYFFHMEKVEVLFSGIKYLSDIEINLNSVSID